MLLKSLGDRGKADESRAETSQDETSILITTNATFSQFSDQLIEQGIK